MGKGQHGGKTSGGIESGVGPSALRLRPVTNIEPGASIAGSARWEGNGGSDVQHEKETVPAYVTAAWVTA
ncbi:hypothetical protein GCM10008949_08530 [Deinococcus humi]|nr:hypothetical protein GCM10008949_08530 [Deinococcus humi]